MLGSEGSRSHHRILRLASRRRRRTESWEAREAEACSRRRSRWHYRGDGQNAGKRGKPVTAYAVDGRQASGDGQNAGKRGKPYDKLAHPAALVMAETDRMLGSEGSATPRDDAGIPLVRRRTECWEAREAWTARNSERGSAVRRRTECWEAREAVPTIASLRLASRRRRRTESWEAREAEACSRRRSRWHYRGDGQNAGKRGKPVTAYAVDGRQASGDGQNAGKRGKPYDKLAHPAALVMAETDRMLGSEGSATPRDDAGIPLVRRRTECWEAREAHRP